MAKQPKDAPESRESNEMTEFKDYQRVIDQATWAGTGGFKCPDEPAKGKK